MGETSLFLIWSSYACETGAHPEDLKAMTGCLFSVLVLTPGQTQTAALPPPLHCIKPIIPHQGLFSVTACVLCTRASKKKKKSVANEVSATAAETVNMFFSSSRYERMGGKKKKSGLLLEDLIPRSRPLPGAR